MGVPDHGRSHIWAASCQQRRKTLALSPLGTTTGSLGMSHHPSPRFYWGQLLGTKQRSLQLLLASADGPSPHAQSQAVQHKAGPVRDKSTLADSSVGIRTGNRAAKARPSAGNLPVLCQKWDWKLLRSQEPQGPIPGQLYVSGDTHGR